MCLSPQLTTIQRAFKWLVRAESQTLIKHGKTNDMEIVRAIRQTKTGRLFLRILAVVSLFVLLAPTIVTIFLGIASGWFNEVLEVGDLGYLFASSVENMQTWDSELALSIVTILPAISFVLVYAGNNQARLTRFGLFVLLTLLCGFLVGLTLSALVDPLQHQLPCVDSRQCISWLSHSCAQSARQCLTFLLLIIGFDRLSVSTQSSHDSSEHQ